MTGRNGRCMCGAVTFTARNVPGVFNACCCDMCRRITGSRFMSVWMHLSDLSLTGKRVIKTVQSSDWAERAFCGECGSALWYRPKSDGDDGHIGLSLGLFDDIEDMTFDAEFYTDRKTCASDARDPANPMTGAEVLIHFNVEGPD